MPSIVKLSACAVFGLSLAGLSCATDLPGQPQPLPHISTLSAFQTGVYHFYDQTFKPGFIISTIKTAVFLNSGKRQAPNTA